MTEEMRRDAAVTPAHGAYRPEIDGLRAIAVVAVLLFHLAPRVMPGGFAGVDVFFVISGYLITRILMAEMGRGDFSILRFYERRARRILPALYFVMAVSTVAAWYLMLPDQLENFGQSLVATTIFANNFLLAITTGYWDVSIDLKPLVHTWTLAIEEQFYLFFPILLTLLQRSSKSNTMILFIGLAIASFVAGVSLAHYAAQIGFYVSPGRFWELLAGSLCSLVDQPARRHAKFLGWLGLILILTSLFIPSTGSPLQPAWTIVPVAGAMLIVLFGSSSSGVGRALSWYPLVGIGLMSYSLYLWHQPVFAFLRISARSQLTPMELATVVPLIFAVAWLSWWHIERPFRDRRKVGPRWFVASVLALTAILISIGLALHLSHGAPERVFPPAIGRSGAMNISYNESAYRDKRDAFGSNKPVKLLVIGNSFGRDIVNVVKEGWGEQRIEILYRDDMGTCLQRDLTEARFRGIVAGADAIFINWWGGKGPLCLKDDIAWADSQQRTLLYFGPKTFGVNINWLVRIDPDRRARLLNQPDRHVVEQDTYIERRIPPGHFVSLMRLISVGNKVRFTDENGLLLSPDARHLTQQGASYIAMRLAHDPRFISALGPSRLSEPVR